MKYNDNYLKNIEHGFLFSKSDARSHRTHETGHPAMHWTPAKAGSYWEWPDNSETSNHLISKEISSQGTQVCLRKKLVGFLKKKNQCESIEKSFSLGKGISTSCNAQVTI